ncbi:hypothetical protein RYX36_033921 [Vicia faba]
MSRCRNILGLNITVTSFIQKYPNVFLPLSPLFWEEHALQNHEENEGVNIVGRCCCEKRLHSYEYSDEFRLVDLEIVALVDWDDELGKARVAE